MIDQTPQAQADAAALTRVLAAIGAKLQRERGLTAEQVGAAMIAAGVNALSGTWEGPKVVEFLAGVTGGMMATHGIEPSGEVIHRGRPN